MFDRFCKTDRSRSMDKTGAVSAYIVKNIINLHGSEICPLKWRRNRV
ncbi:MAG: hypothetical protein ACLSV6_01675 [Butyricicoccus sp.]